MPAKALAWPPPKQKPVAADATAAVRASLEPAGGGDEILGHLGPVERSEQLAALVVIAGVAADRGQGVGREGHEVLQGEAARHVLGVRV